MTVKRQRSTMWYLDEIEKEARTVLGLRERAAVDDGAMIELLEAIDRLQKLNEELSTRVDWRSQETRGLPAESP